MRLTEPGLYVARDGRVAMSDEDGVFYIRGTDGIIRLSQSDSKFTDGEWQRIDLDVVEWPELPPKPLLCRVAHRGCFDDEWVTITGQRYYRRDEDGGNPYTGVVTKYLRVIEDDRNDPEAVAMIEAAKEGHDAD